MRSGSVFKEDSPYRSVSAAPSVARNLKMAEPINEQQSRTLEDDEKKLKHLDFVQVAAIYLVVCFSTVYEYAKDNAGPLKLGVETVEASVRTVLSPVYEKFHDVPFELLRFVDRKVDDVLKEAETYVPSLVKQASTQVLAVATEVHRAGVVDATKSIARSVYEKYEPTARDLYARYEPVTEQYAAAAWRLLNRLPLFPEVAQIVVPAASYWSEKYNEAVCYAGERGYPLAPYLPLIPIEKIARIFEQDQSSGPGVSANGKIATGL